MFNKPKTDTPDAKRAVDFHIPDDLPDLRGGQSAPRPAASAPSRGASTLTSALVFEGNISGAGELIVDGMVKGDLKVGRLTVGESGTVEGSIKAETIEVRGKVVGSIAGKHVRLLGTAYVDGDIVHEQLAIEVGSFFQGRCTQTRPAPAAVPQPVAAAQPQVRAPEMPSPSVSSTAKASVDAPRVDVKS